MSDNFRQEVEEIENTSELKISHELSKSGWCKGNRNCVTYRNCTNCIKQWKTDHICAAHDRELERIAKGIDKGRVSTHERKQIVEAILAERIGKTKR